DALPIYIEISAGFFLEGVGHVVEEFCRVGVGSLHDPHTQGLPLPDHPAVVTIAVGIGCATITVSATTRGEHQDCSRRRHSGPNLPHLSSSKGVGPRA